MKITTGQTMLLCARVVPYKEQSAIRINNRTHDLRLKERGRYDCLQAECGRGLVNRGRGFDKDAKGLPMGSKDAQSSHPGV